MVAKELSFSQVKKLLEQSFCDIFSSYISSNLLSIILYIFNKPSLKQIAIKLPLGLHNKPVESFY